MPVHVWNGSQELGGGQYRLVMEGSCTFGGRRLDRLGIALLYPGDPPLEIVALETGTTLLALQFPRMLASSGQST